MDRLAVAEAVGDFGSHFAPCAAVHPWFDYCRDVQPDRCISVMKWMAPIVSLLWSSTVSYSTTVQYGALHFIPMLLFKNKALRKDPLKMLYKAAFGTLRSSTFLGVFVMLYQCQPFARYVVSSY
jgi:hypothetical protein